MTDWVKAWCDDHPNFGLTKDILSLRKELATAKAENGRLIEAMRKESKRIESEVQEALNRLTKYPESSLRKRISGIVRYCRFGIDATLALSSSNSLDYWQGEIREARAEAFKEDAEWHKLCASRYPEKSRENYIHRMSRQKSHAEADRQSNQSKGERVARWEK